MAIEVSQKAVLVVGLGKSGEAAARFLVHRGARVTVTDQSPAVQIGERAAALERLGVRLELGGHSPASFAAADLIVLSPGVPHTLEPLAQARRRGVAVIGEIELAARFLRTPLLAVTGTNGKTTTTALLGEMLTCSGLRVFVGGNIGSPLIGHVDSGQAVDRVVVEVSSFQLDTIATFRPSVGVWLNISDDHLDRYPGPAAYAASKARLFENQQAADAAILNGQAETIRRLTAACPARRLYFTGRRAGEWGASLTAEGLVIEDGRQPIQHIDLQQMQLQGVHNRENAAAAALAALAAGGTAAGVESALARFQGLPHRVETVAVVAGVRYVDDSKATNVDAVVRALEGFREPVVLIMGGRDKLGSYEALKAPVRRGVRQLILIGEARDRIQAALAPECPGACLAAASMDQAVALAHAAARPGEVVLLSPACASFDMFDSYAHRGDCFRRAVDRLKGAR
ncbi:MAG: UDP-N-acetylmuramoyl-L-alanine--D-glutamate ligase [Desulfobacterales bacterium]